MKYKNILAKIEENSSSETSYQLDLRYENDNGINKDEKEAVASYRTAAKQNHPLAQNNLGWCFYHGIGVEKDEIEAVIWYNKAAMQNNADAQNNLGWCCAIGAGVVKDEKEAVKWYRKAAKQNHADAQNNLGYCYEMGIGVKKNRKKAIIWYRKATAQAHATAKCNLKRCLLRANKKIKKTLENAQELICGVVLTFKTPLNRGDFGQVYLGVWNGNDVAIKIPLKKQNFMEEVLVIKKLKSPNIVRYIAHSENPPRLVMEYMPKGSLYDLLNQSPLGWDTCYKIVKGLVNGLNYLHEHQIEHRDIKIDNVLLDQSFEPKWSDFGSADDHASDSKNTINTITGESLWTKYDIFKFGTILWELAQRKIPQLQPIDIMGEGKQESITKVGCPLSLAALIRGCWDPTPLNRPSARNLAVCFKEAKDFGTLSVPGLK